MNPHTQARRFGKVLRRARKRAGLRQQDIADAIGTGVPYVSDLEAGRRGPVRSPKLLQLAEVLRVPYAVLIAATGVVELEHNSKRLAQANAQVVSFLRGANMLAKLGAVTARITVSAKAAAVEARTYTPEMVQTTVELCSLARELTDLLTGFPLDEDCEVAPDTGASEGKVTK